MREKKDVNQGRRVQEPEFKPGRKASTGGEAQKQRTVPRGTGGRTGSSKQRKG